AKDPELLFADEPTSALDRENGARVAGLLHAMARDRGPPSSASATTSASARPAFTGSPEAR
ncbi:MAG: hypothetical protein ACXW25_12645, partial [Rhodospirillales bacterium]